MSSALSTPKPVALFVCFFCISCVCFLCTNDSNISLTLFAEMIHTVIGTGQSGSFKNGHVTAPSSLLIDHEGRLVIASTNCLLRYSAAQLELLAGSEDEAGFVDGPGAEARFQQITSLALDPYGNIFVCDGENNAVRCVSSSGDVQTIISGLTPTKSNQYFEFPLLAPSAVAVDESSYEAGCPRVFVSDLHRLIEIELDCKSQAEQPLVHCSILLLFFLSNKFIQKNNF
jgi:hypothetical protein